MRLHVYDKAIPGPGAGTTIRSLVLFPYLRRDTPNFLSTMQRPKPRSREYLFITMASSMSYLRYSGCDEQQLGQGLRKTHTQRCPSYQRQAVRMHSFPCVSKPCVSQPCYPVHLVTPTRYSS